MGQFSWLDCQTKEQIRDDYEKDVYVLIPKEFGGGHIVEHCYDGYGHFGGYDIYELVAEWNKKFLADNPGHKTHACWGNQIKDTNWYKKVSTGEKLSRIVGIDIACYDEDNRILPYPIKITYNKKAVYEDCESSDSDPDQGWW